MLRQNLNSKAGVLHTNGDLSGYLKNQTEPWLAGSSCVRMKGALNYGEKRSCKLNGLRGSKIRLKILKFTKPHCLYQQGMQAVTSATVQVARHWLNDVILAAEIASSYGGIKNLKDARRIILLSDDSVIQTNTLFEDTKKI